MTNKDPKRSFISLYVLISDCKETDQGEAIELDVERDVHYIIHEFHDANGCKDATSKRMIST